MARKDSVILALILIPSLFIRIYRLDYHNGETVFDERAYYQEAALSYLEGTDDPNSEHPPLGKEILAVGIKVLGNTPIGIRFPSVIFSIASLAVVYFLFRDIFNSRLVGALSGIFLSLDFMFFIHSRLGTMEIFYLFFLWADLYFFYRADYFLENRLTGKGNLALLTAAVFLALSFSTKWTAVLGLLSISLIFLGRRDLGNLIKLAIFSLLAVAVVYTAAYLPYILRHSLSEYWQLQVKTFNFWASFAGKQAVKLTFEQYLLNHAFAWPANPAWNYDSIKHASGTIQVVWAFYNPILFFPSLFLFLRHLWETKLRVFLRRQNLPALVVLASFIPWLFVVRIQYTYYFLPAIPFLYSFLAQKLAQIYARDKWLFSSFVITVLAVFSYFYPLITNWPVPDQYLIFYPLRVENSL